MIFSSSLAAFDNDYGGKACFNFSSVSRRIYNVNERDKKDGNDARHQSVSEYVHSDYKFAVRL